MAFIIEGNGTTFIDNRGGLMTWQEAEELFKSHGFAKMRDSKQFLSAGKLFRTRILDAYKRIRVVCVSDEAFDEAVNMFAAFRKFKDDDDCGEYCVNSFLSGLGLINSYDFIVMSPCLKEAYEKSTCKDIDSKESSIRFEMERSLHCSGCIVGKYCKFIGGVLPDSLKKDFPVIELDERDWKDR